MANTSFNLELQAKPNASGVYPIYIRITRSKKKTRIRTSVEVQKAHWNPKGAKNQNWVRSGDMNAAKKNHTLAQELEEVRSTFWDNKQASVEALAKMVKNPATSTSFLAYAIAATESLAAQGRSNAKHYGTLCNKLQGYLDAKGVKDLTFSDLSPALLADFANYLKMEKSQKNRKEGRRLSQNYIRTLLKKFETLVNNAIKEGRMPVEKNPFGKGKFEKPGEESADRTALEVKEYAAIAALEYPEGSRLWHTKNAFLFACNCGGIRAGDLMRLRWENIKDEGSRYEYKQGKTGNDARGRITPDASHILKLYHTDSSKPSDYIFPFLDCSAAFAKYRTEEREKMPVELKVAQDNQVYSNNTLLNKHLKQIAQDAGIEKRLSMHIARHTFASISQAFGATALDTMTALGHNKLSTTDKYLHSLENGGGESATSAFAKGIASEAVKPSTSTSTTTKRGRRSEIEALKARLAALLAEEDAEGGAEL